MRLQHVAFLGIALAVIGATPALAYQGRGTGGQAQPQAGAMQGAAPQHRLRDHGQVYGWQLMTPEERSAHRQKMRTLKTPQEREAFRKQHHEEMQKRAKERGMTLPDMPRQMPGGMQQQKGPPQGQGK